MRIEVDDTYITNIPKGERVAPRGEPYTAFMICRRIVRGHSKRFVEVITGDTKREWHKRILAFVRKKHVVVVPETPW